MVKLSTGLLGGVFLGTWQIKSFIYQLSYDLVNEVCLLYINWSVLASRIGHAITSPPFTAGRHEI